MSDPRDPREIELQGQADTLALGVSFSPDGRYLAASNSNTVRLWIVKTGEEWATLKGHSNNVSSIAFLDGGRTLVSASVDQTIKLWDIARAGAERDVLTGHKGSVWSLAFTPEGQTLFSGGNNGMIKRWDVATGRERPPLEVPDKEHLAPGALVQAGSPASPSTAGPWPTTARTCGTWKPVGSSNPSPSVPLRGPCPSRPRGQSWRRLGITAPSCCGTWPLVGNCIRRSGSATLKSTPWPSRPTAGSWPRETIAGP